ncbi:MAG: hypothetical protein U5K28_03360 [Halobacteriales archaeon]|nr:hypothetical protein [Halobacteriales archaeon]
MAWVDSEYASELAVVSAWLTVLLPWSLSFAQSQSLSLVTVRFPVAMFQFLLGTDADIDPFVPAWAAPGLEQSNAALQLAYYVWLAGAVVLGIAFVFSLLYYSREQLVNTWLSVSPVRLMGGLLTVGGGCLLVATVRIFQSTAGVTFPLGAVLVPLLGVTLLRTHARSGNER